ncbi:hypothetical protein [Veillonella criceti]|nr:hypothetical protein [Veillonella criceti]
MMSNVVGATDQGKHLGHYKSHVYDGRDKLKVVNSDIIAQLLRGKLDSTNEEIDDKLQKDTKEKSKKQISERALPVILAMKANLPVSYFKAYIKNNFTDVSRYVLYTGLVNSAFKSYVQPNCVEKGLLELASYGFMNEDTSDAFTRYMVYDLNTDKIYYSKCRVYYDTNSLKTSEVEAFDGGEVADLSMVHDVMEELAQRVGYRN